MLIHQATSLRCSPPRLLWLLLLALSNPLLPRWNLVPRWWGSKLMLSPLIHRALPLVRRESLMLRSSRSGRRGTWTLQGPFRLRLPHPSPTFSHRTLEDLDEGFPPTSLSPEISREAKLDRQFIDPILAADWKTIRRRDALRLNQITPDLEETIVGVGGGDFVGGGGSKPRFPQRRHVDHPQLAKKLLYHLLLPSNMLWNLRPLLISTRRTSTCFVSDRWGRG